MAVWCIGGYGGEFLHRLLIMVIITKCSPRPLPNLLSRLSKSTAYSSPLSLPFQVVDVETTLTMSSCRICVFRAVSC